ncbi:MAG: methylglutaconyl-CoA hydratase, partial [Limisphaerales bacterium]
ADLKAFAGMIEDNPGSDIPNPESDITIGDLFRKLYKPCIAQVQGPVYAGGFLMICGCTHVVSVSDAVFGLPEVKRGIWPMQVMASLSNIVAARPLLDWCMRGTKIDSKRALELGVITDITQKDTLSQTVEIIRDELLENSPVAIQNGLQAFDEMQDKSNEGRHKYLQDMLKKTLMSEDAREGLLAFREKRKPVWPGK